VLRSSEKKGENLMAWWDKELRYWRCGACEIRFFIGTVHWADEERNEGWEPEGNVPHLLHYRFAKGEREKMVA